MAKQTTDQIKEATFEVVEFEGDVLGFSRVKVAEVVGERVFRVSFVQKHGDVRTAAHVSREGDPFFPDLEVNHNIRPPIQTEESLREAAVVLAQALVSAEYELNSVGNV